MALTSAINNASFPVISFKDIFLLSPCSDRTEATSQVVPYCGAAGLVDSSLNYQSELACMDSAADLCDWGGAVGSPQDSPSVMGTTLVSVTAALSL